MASLLERMNISTDSFTGPIRHKGSHSSNRGTAPYNRAQRIPKGDVDSPWAHDLYDSSLASRIAGTPGPPKVNLNTLSQKALKDATTSRTPGALSIKGASALSQGNVVEVTGLVAGTTPEDVASIFKRCGEITNSKSVSGNDEVQVRLTFKASTSAAAAVQKFHNQPADGKVLSVRIVGSTAAGATLKNRLGGTDGLGLVREEGSVDILMETDGDSNSKMRSDSLLRADPRAQVLVAPPGANPADYVQAPTGPRNNGPRRGGGGRGGGRGGRRGRRGGNGGLESRMETD